MVAATVEELKCRYCNKTFKRASSFEVHMCEAKRRHRDQNEPGVRLGFQCYLRFYETTTGGSRAKTYTDFASSPYFRAFVKFGRYCVDIRAINPTAFTEFLLKKNRRLDYWTSDQLYTEYLLEYLQHESVEDALSRAIRFAMDWSDETGCPSHDFLRFGNVNRVLHAITTGRISPWVIYQSEGGQEFLSKRTPDQIAGVWAYIDSAVWERKFRRYPEEVAYARDILERAGW